MKSYKCSQKKGLVIPKLKLKLNLSHNFGLQVNKKLDEKLVNLKQKNKAAQIRLGTKYALPFLFLGSLSKTYYNYYVNSFIVREVQLLLCKI